MLRRLLSLFAILLIRALRITWKIEIRGRQPVAADGPVVFCFYHGKQAGLLAYRHHRPFAALVSLSSDGQIQAGILRGLGFVVCRGSSSRNGSAGLKAMLDAVRGGCDAVMAVDGPRGPIHQSKPGAIALALHGEARIVPITASSSRSWVASKAWDRYELPKPFARVTIAVAAPIDPARLDCAGLDRCLQSLEESVETEISQSG